jgi:hypothetical protein
MVALSLGHARRWHVNRSSLWTDVRGEPGCQLSHTSCMFGERSFQLLKNVVQFGRFRSRTGFMAKLSDPIFESLKHGQRLGRRQA